MIGSLPPDRQRYGVTIDGQDDLILFAPPPLPRQLEVGVNLTALECVPFHVGRLSAKLEMLPNPSSIYRLLSRWNSVTVGGSQARAKDLLSLLISEHSEQTVVSPNLKQAANCAAAYERMVLDPDPAFGQDMPERVEMTIKEIHRLLTMQIAVDGRDGNYRMQAAVSSGFVSELGRIGPPPPERIPDCMRDLAQFIAFPPALPLLSRIAMVCAQMMAIVPFSYGSQTVSRILATAMSVWAGYTPLFAFEFLSGGHLGLQGPLRSAILEGNWEPWLGLFAEGAAASIKMMNHHVEQLNVLHSIWRSRISGSRLHSNIHAVAGFVLTEPVITAGRVKAVLGVSFSTANTVISKLIEAGILRPHTPLRRGRVFFAPEVFDMFANCDRAPSQIQEIEASQYVHLSYCPICAESPPVSASSSYATTYS